MHNVILHQEDGFWIAKSASYPEFVSKGRTRLQARAKFRKAVQRLEKHLESVESDPKFIEMMERSEADIRDGRYYTQEEVESIFRNKWAAKKS